jgi:hypothetical protein
VGEEEREKLESNLVSKAPSGSALALLSGGVEIVVVDGLDWQRACGSNKASLIFRAYKTHADKPHCQHQGLDQTQPEREGRSGRRTLDAEATDALKEVDLRG